MRVPRTSMKSSVPGAEAARPIVGQGWTLNFEMFFYACFALLAFLDARTRVVWLTIGFGALALGGWLLQPEGAILRFYMSFMPLAFCAGAWLGLGTLRGHIQGGGRHLIALVAAAVIFGMVEGFALDRGGLVEDSGAFIGFLAAATGVVWLAVRLEARLPRVRLLELIGDASFSIYLVHIYEVAILAGLAFKLLDPHDLWADYFVAAVSVTGGVGAGIVVYRLVEMPLLDVLTRLRLHSGQRGGLPADAVDHRH